MRVEGPQPTRDAQPRLRTSRVCRTGVGCGADDAGPERGPRPRPQRGPCQSYEFVQRCGFDLGDEVVGHIDDELVVRVRGVEVLHDQDWSGPLEQRQPAPRRTAADTLVVAIAASGFESDTGVIASATGGSRRSKPAAAGRTGTPRRAANWV